MAITITVPTALRRFAGNQPSVEVAGHTIQEILKDLIRQHPQLGQHLYDKDGKLRNFVRIYVNDEDIRATGDHTPVKEGDEIAIVPSIAGGVEPIIKDRAKLTNDDIKRYSRHLILPEVGMKAKNASRPRRCCSSAPVGLAHRSRST